MKNALDCITDEDRRLDAEIRKKADELNVLLAQAADQEITVDVSVETSSDVTRRRARARQILVSCRKEIPID